MKHEILYLRHLYQQRGRENVLTGVDLRLYRGEIVFLLGRAGSGKTTLCEIMSGRLQPDRGEILCCGRRVTLHGPHAASRQGIHLIGAQSCLFENLSLGENICIRNPVRFSLGGYVSQVEASAAILCRELHIDLDPHVRAHAAAHSLIDRILVETARAVNQRARIILYDNLLWMLTVEERARLFVLLERLKAMGITSVVSTSEFGRICDGADRFLFLEHGAIAADYDRLEACWSAADRLSGEPLLLPAAPAAQADGGSSSQRRRFRFENDNGQEVALALAPGERVGLYCPVTGHYRRMLNRFSDAAWLNAQNDLRGWNCRSDDICTITLENLHRDCFLQLSAVQNVTLPALSELLPPVHLTLRRSSRFLREEICTLLSREEKLLREICWTDSSAFWMERRPNSRRSIRSSPMNRRILACSPKPLWWTVCSVGS
ncbi:ATP-binding cassette domain-containing protein [Butyricicoccus pullicaecorum]|nr:ATP-binding cassette domain-containing protein [Butyricicoccus pullicaecorum]